MVKSLKPCTKCGCPDTPKFKRDIKGRIYTAKFCILCHREDQRVRYDKYWLKNRDKHLKIVRDKRRGDPHYQELARKSYYKNRMKILDKKRREYVPVKCDKRFGFSLYEEKNILL